MPSPNYYFKFEHRDWLSSSTVEDMSSAARGAYVCLLCYQWEDGFLPDDIEKLAKRAKVTPQEFKKLWLELEANFPVCADGHRRNQKLADQAFACLEIKQSRSEAGRKGGSTPKQRNGKDQPNGNQNESKTEANAFSEGKQNEAITESESETGVPKVDESTLGDDAPHDPPDGKLDEQSWFCRIQAILEAKAVRCKDFSPPVRADVVRHMAKNKPGLGNLILVLDELHAGGKIPEKPDDLAVELFVKALDEWPDVGWEGVFTNRAALYKKLHPSSEKGTGSVHALAGGRR